MLTRQDSVENRDKALLQFLFSRLKPVTFSYIETERGKDSEENMTLYEGNGDNVRNNVRNNG